MNDSLADMYGANAPPFPAVVKLELDKALAFIGPVENLLTGYGGIRDEIEPVLLRRAFPRDAPGADMTRGV